MKIQRILPLFLVSILMQSSIFAMYSANPALLRSYSTASKYVKNPTVEKGDVPQAGWAGRLEYMMNPQYNRYTNPQAQIPQAELNPEMLQVVTNVPAVDVSGASSVQFLQPSETVPWRSFKEISRYKNPALATLQEGPDWSLNMQKLMNSDLASVQPAQFDMESFKKMKTSVMPKIPTAAPIISDEEKYSFLMNPVANPVEIFKQNFEKELRNLTAMGLSLTHRSAQELKKLMKNPNPDVAAFESARHNIEEADHIYRMKKIQFFHEKNQILENIINQLDVNDVAAHKVAQELKQQIRNSLFQLGVKDMTYSDFEQMFAENPEKRKARIQNLEDEFFGMFGEKLDRTRSKISSEQSTEKPMFSRGAKIGATGLGTLYGLKKYQEASE